MNNKLDKTLPKTVAKKELSGERFELEGPRNELD
jgi:hypothetical protein